MNPKLQQLFARRSVRRYQERPVPEELLTDLLQAAMAAPSAVARDPWHFIVVRDQQMRDRIADLLPNGGMARQAAAVLVVCGDLERAHGGLESYLLQDCSAAVENILLAAVALGLGACWLGVHPRPERVEGMRALFNLPPQIVPVAGIALGWPVEAAQPRTRFRADAVHWERW
jgi:nitroreductase